MLSLSKDDVVCFHSAVDVGIYLRSKRKELDLSIQEAAQDTKISIDFLKAIEDGVFDKFPGQVYAIGFVRSYSLYLGLDAHFVTSSLKVCSDFRQNYAESISSTTIPLEEPETKKNVAISVALLSIFIFATSCLIKKTVLFVDAPLKNDIVLPVS
ncbi:MAG: hypothetical protein NEHIOOID_01153 [Holosporales bacterium]